MPDPSTVFVVHGRDEDLRVATFDLLRAMGLKPLEWTSAVTLTAQGSPYVGEILDAAYRTAQVVVVLLTPDDEVRLHRDLRNPHLSEPLEDAFTLQSRPNVLFEAGMAFGLKPERTILVQIGNVKPFSDIGGRHVVRLDNSIASREALAERLRTAGCLLNMQPTWPAAGDFTVNRLPVRLPLIPDAEAGILHVRDAAWQPFLTHHLTIAVKSYFSFAGQVLFGTSLTASADALALGVVAEVIRELGGSSSAVASANELTGDRLSANLILIGGPYANRASREVLSRLHTRYRFGTPIWYDISIRDSATGYRYTPKRKGLQLRSDHGIAIRTANPFNPGKKVLVLAGSFGAGTYAAASFMANPRLLKDIPFIGEGRDFEVLVEIDVAQGWPQTPRILHASPIT